MLNLQINKEEYDALMFALKSDLETVVNDADNWTIGEIAVLTGLVKKLEGLGDGDSIRLLDERA